MCRAVEGGVVFDTTIYYKDPDRVQSWLDANGFVVFFTPNNALELITPKSGITDKDFEKRKQAVRNLLALTDGGQRELPDTEMFQAIQLGFHPTSSEPWVESAERFLALTEYTPEACTAVGLNLEHACDAMDLGYDQFVQNVGKLQAVYQKIWTQTKEGVKAVGGNYAMWHSHEVVRGILSESNAMKANIVARAETICTIAEVSQWEGTPVDQSRYEIAIGIYVQAYVGYLEYALCTDRLDKNDFGDLQFFAYCDGGYRLVSSENRWHDISIQEGLENHLLYFR